MLPRTIILGTNLHGEIPLDEQGQPHTTPLQIKTLIELNAVTCGVPNVSTFETYDRLSNVVDEFIEAEPLNWNEEHSRAELVSYTEQIRDLLVEDNAEERKDIEKQYRKMRRSEPSALEKHFESYVHTTEKAYKISAFKQGDTISNKLFYRFSPAELDQYDIDEDDIADAYFDKIFVYNTDDKIDIFELLESIGYDMSEITLFQLIEMLPGIGVENIILIDLACNIFKDSNNTMLSARSTRAKRREMEKQGLRGGGKKNKKQTHRKKTKTYKKKQTKHKKRQTKRHR